MHHVWWCIMSHIYSFFPLHCNIDSRRADTFVHITDVSQDLAWNSAGATEGIPQSLLSTECSMNSVLYCLLLVNEPKHLPLSKQSSTFPPPPRLEMRTHWLLRNTVTHQQSSTRDVFAIIQEFMTQGENLKPLNLEYVPRALRGPIGWKSVNNFSDFWKWDVYIFQTEVSVRTFLRDTLSVTATLTHGVLWLKVRVKGDFSGTAVIFQLQDV